MDSNKIKQDKKEDSTPQNDYGKEILAGQVSPNHASHAKEYQIDAKGKRLGRIATEAATVLLGKNAPDFTKHLVAPVSVKITNARLLDISEKRSKEEFQTYSGHPGGRKVETLDHLAHRRGYGEVLRRVIGGMLPKNKLHKIRMHNLDITE